MKFYIEDTGETLTLPELQQLYRDNFEDIYPDYDLMTEDEKSVCTFEYWISDGIAYGEIKAL